MDRAKLFAVIKREYMERVRSRWFVIGTLLFPVIMSGLILIPARMAIKSRASVNVGNMQILDATGSGLGERVAKRLLTDSAGPTAKVPSVVQVAPAALAQAESTATKDVIAKRTQGYLVLDSMTLAGKQARYSGRNASAGADMDLITSAVRRSVMMRALEGSGMSTVAADSLTQMRVQLKTEKLTDTGRGGSGGASIAFAFGIVIIMYMSMLLYGQAVLRSVLEEKTTRVAEVVVSSVSPDTLLVGKVIGVGAVGLTQIISWIVISIYVVGTFGERLLGIPRAGLGAGAAATASAGITLPQVAPWTYGALLLFFVLGFTFYSSLFAAVGAMVNSEQEAQQAATPVTMLIVVSFIFMQPVMMNPSSTLAKVMSWMPFSAPIMMPLRMSLVSVPPLEVVAVLLGVLLACVAALWLSARIYRVGLLMYGKRPSMRELARWVRQSA